MKSTVLSGTLFGGMLFFAHALKTPCNTTSSVDITNGEIFTNNSILHEGIVYSEGQWFEERHHDKVVRRGCICLIQNCLWKCCGEGEAQFGKQCGVSHQPAVNPFSPLVYRKATVLEDVVANDHFKYFYGNPCPGDRYSLDPNDEADQFYLQKDGVLYQPGAWDSDQRHPATTFCLDFFERDPSSANDTAWVPRIMSIVCFISEDVDAAAPYAIYAVGLLISVPFLLATLTVYASLRQLRNLHGRCLMSYVSGLLVAFSCLAYLQLNPRTISASMTGCYAIAFVIFYSFMSSFFWLNVMCFDIWRTFSRYGGKSTNPARELRRFAWYGAYAWGMALLMTATTALMEFHEGIPQHITKPSFGTTKCWFADRRREMVYFYAPILVLVVANSALFGVTAYSILRIRRETAILKNSESARTDQYERDKQRYTLYLKLFVVMGVNWTLEVLSFLIKGSDWMWIVPDITNSFLGIFIFIIFVWKNNVRNLLIKKYRRMRYGKNADVSPSHASTCVRDSTTHTDTRTSDNGLALGTLPQRTKL